MSEMRFNQLCVPIAETTAVRAVAGLKKAKAVAKWVELRLDYLETTREIEKLLSLLSRMRLPQNLVFTLRRMAAGGEFGGTVEAQVRWLLKSATLGRWVDLEIESLQSAGPGILKDFHRCGAGVILSYHNFRAVPGNLKKIALLLASYPVNIIKIAVSCQSMKDAGNLLALQDELRQRGIRSVVLGMGASGLPTRVLGPSRGAVFTFATLDPHRKSAPGQLTVEEMVHVYRAPQINRHTRVLGIVGSPLDHSLSPILYNSAFASLRMNAVFLKLETKEVDGFKTWARQLGLKGTSVTLPHKTRVVRYLSKMEPGARTAGAVNTICRKKNRWVGYNTDITGISSALEGMKLLLAGSNVLLLGAGGAAQAACAFLTQKRARVFIFNRTSKKAKALAKKFGQQVVKRSDLPKRGYSLVINATSVGMWPNTEETPIGLNSIRADVVFDMVYNPPTTRLLREAKQLRVRTVSGLEMFTAQAKRQFRLLTGKELPASVLNKVRSRKKR